MVIGTGKKRMGKIGDNKIYKVSDSAMIRLYDKLPGYDHELEERYISIFKGFDLTNCFYFSYTYNLS
jgi:hypothetical protein